jgi:hypothetical protein
VDAFWYKKSIWLDQYKQPTEKEKGIPPAPFGEGEYNNII